MEIQIVTPSGFECVIDDDVLNDMELFEGIVELDKGNILEIPGVVSKLFGPEDKKRLYDHVRDSFGRVPMDAFSAELTAIFKSLDESKKK